MGKQEKKASISIEDGNLTVPGGFVERLIDLFEGSMEREEVRKDAKFTMEKNKEDWMNERREFVKGECEKVEDKLKTVDILSTEYSELLKVYNKLINIDKSYMW
jgi:hypothetical protein